MLRITKRDYVKLQYVWLLYNVSSKYSNYTSQFDMQRCEARVT